MNWKEITTANDITTIVAHSHEVPCLIFKHSTRCEISAIAKYRLESAWSELHQTIEPYYLDVLTNRAVSQQIAGHFSVHHESPQILLIRQGECMYDASHLDISIDELNKVLYAVSI